MSAQIPLSLPRDPEQIQTAFANDAMDRKAFAEKITPALLQLAVNGGVLTLDAPWGEGKSWFGRHWRKMLDDQVQVKTCWIDAFEQDYIENPFELVAAELVDAMGWRENEELLDKTVSVMNLAEKTFGAVAKGFGRALGIAASAHLGAPTEVKAGEAAAGAAADFAAQAVSDGNAWLKGRLLAHSKEKQAIREFRKAMQAQLAEEPMPMVVFVDELDRCRPDFAVRLLECIKHFFDVPNLVFVLLLNRDQLEKAVKGVYGAEVDAHLYLHKFIHLPLRLPKGGGAFPVSRLQQYVQHLFFDRFRYRTNTTNEWIQDLAVYSLCMDLSLRDLERLVSMLIVGSVPVHPVVKFLACLKIKNPDWYEGFRRRDEAVCGRILQQLRINAKRFDENACDLTFIQQFITEWLTAGDDLPSSGLDVFYRGRKKAKDLVLWFMNDLDSGSRMV
ncbi:MAG: hypothetical protein RL318_1569 [Fibrobacterota bacterium]